MRALLVLFVLGFIVAADAPKKEAGKKDEPKAAANSLNGTWIPVVGFKTGPGGGGWTGGTGKSKITITGDQIEFDAITYLFSKAGKGTVKIDPKTKPPTIEIKTGDQVLKGGYYLEGDGLTVYFPEAGSKIPEKPSPFPPKDYKGSMFSFSKAGSGKSNKDKKAPEKDK